MDKRLVIVWKQEKFILKHFPNRHLLHRRNFEKVDRSLRETGKKASEFKEILKLANFLLVHL